MFEATIDETGRVRDLKTLKTPKISPPWPEIEEACRNTILAWRYKPALLNGKPVPVYLTISVIVDF